MHGPPVTPAAPAVELKQLTIIHAPPEPPGGAGAHEHPVHELLYVVHGRYEVRTRGRRLSGSPGWAFCFAPGQRHRPRFRAGHAPEATSEAILLQWSEPPGRPPRPYPERVHDRSRRLFHALSWMLDLYAADAPADQGALVGLAEVFLHELARPADRREYLLQSVHTYVEDNLDRTIRVADLAEAVGMSRSHFTREFRRAAGRPPMAYVMGVRLAAAMDLVSETRSPLAQIAERVGLSSAFHLSALVRRHYGRPPSAFRPTHPGPRRRRSP